MSITLTPKLRLNGPLVYKHWCDGCNEAHLITVVAHAKKALSGAFIFNGSINSPTFAPSSQVSREDVLYCHYLITEGYIEYLADSKHHLAGKTLPLPFFPPYKIF